MPKIKFDVTGSDPVKATQGFEPPKPGVYTAKVAEINPGFSKGEDGKPDQNKPRLEVIYHITDSRYPNAPLWDYLTFGEGFPKQKMDQFLQAVGVATAKKRKGVLDTDLVIGKLVKVRVRGGTNQNDEYKATVGGVMPATPEDEDFEDAEPEEADEEDEETDDESEDSEEDEDEVEEDEDPYEAMGLKELKAAASAAGLATTGAPSALRVRLREHAAEVVEEEDVEESVEDDGYDALTPTELKKELKSRELPTTGTQAALIKRLRDNDAEPF